MCYPKQTANLASSESPVPCTSFCLLLRLACDIMILFLFPMQNDSTECGSPPLEIS